MKRLVLGVLVLCVTGIAQDKGKVENTVVVRKAIGKKAYNYFEAWQSRGRWIYPDAGYIDFNEGGIYREAFIGAGAILVKSKRVLLIEEGYLDQATGPVSGGALYFQPWTLLNVSITESESWGWQTVYFPYLPLNDAARIQQVIERSVLERNFKHWKIGAGYSGYQFAKDNWDHKPFFTTTLKAGKFGSFEFWLQRVPGNHAQLQVRYAITK